MNMLKQGKYKLLLLICGVGLVTIGIVYNVSKEERKEGILQEFQNEEIAESSDMEDTLININENSKVFVDIKGEVVNQGVYEVDLDSRVKDVIEGAGGFTDNADLKQVNLALQVEDEMVIYVPSIDEEIEGDITVTQANDSKISLNKATIEELQTLNGIGPAKAAAIIAYREEFGPFKEINELLEVSGIGEKSLEKIQKQLKLN
ncbi:helix-hairpin-helix domain-containing protein [Fredinandcohnia sp. 179-A 10B2 NHS]|uniref:helix-hairpin-helix domain-containing protein n=1 Tax=Fredinandcohnia sp. 179-A 10B2 NHS TaxID=3235176 RepID=UPI0039A08B0A